MSDKITNFCKSTFNKFTYTKVNATERDKKVNTNKGDKQEKSKLLEKN